MVAGCTGRNNPDRVDLPAVKRMSPGWKIATASALISLLLLAEVTRKYIFPTNSVLVVAEALAVLTAIALTMRSMARSALPLGAAILSLVAWKMLSIIVGHQDVLLGLVGLRGFLVPCAFLFIGIALARRVGTGTMAALIYATFTVWLVVIGVVMGLQLVAGHDHWLNALPEGFGDEQAGIGNYTVGDLGVDYLFRPTSIFLHTGKAGAVIFVLAAYRLCYALSTIKGSWQLARVALLDVLVLLLSGQRAAMLGSVFSGLMFIAGRVRRILVTRFFAVGMLAVGAVAGIASAMNLSDGALAQVASLMWARFVSGITGIPLRLEDNVIAPRSYVMATFGLRPAGMGAFSFGSSSFGGQPLDEVVPFGTAENTWLRLLAEEGIFVLVGEAILWISLCVFAIRRGIKRDGYQVRQLARSISQGAGIILAVLMLWANTHDILGSTVPMSLSMTLLGVSYVHYQRTLESAACYAKGRAHAVPVSKGGVAP